MSNETSKILEEIPFELLDEREVFTVIIHDMHGIREEKTITLKELQTFKPENLDPNFRPFDLTSFYELTARIIKHEQEKQGISSANIVAAVQDSQPENIAEISNGNEIITMRVLSREPAKMDRKGTGRIQRGPNISHDFMLAEDPNKVVVVSTRPIDHSIEICCWATTSTLANERALWIEKLLERYKYAYLSQGVDRLFWESRGPDTLYSPSGQRLHQRPLKFKLRLHEIEIKTFASLRQFEIEIERI